MNIKLTDKDKIKINCGDDIYGIMQRILLRENKIDRNKEHFWIIGLNQVLSILYIELVSMGSTKQTLVDPMNVFRVAVLKGATRIIAIHNHPSGELTPSKEDLDITDKLNSVGKIIGIDLDDHIIISTESFLSFKATGLMDEVANSLKYVPSYIIEEKVKLQEEFTKTTINNLSKKGMTAEQIADIVGIAISEVEKINNQ